jgi:transposase
LLADMLAAKFADHLPLYRQSVIYAREGVDLDRALLASWVAPPALLHSLVDAIRKHVLAAAKLHADDTPVPALAPDNGKTKTGRLWTYVRDDRPAGDLSPPAIWFAYSPDRKGIHPQMHLANFQGVLQGEACQLQCPVGGWRHRRSGMLSACAQQVPRPARGAPIPADDRGAAPYRRTVSDRAEIRGRLPDERLSVR